MTPDAGRRAGRDRSLACPGHAPQRKARRIPAAKGHDHPAQGTRRLGPGTQPPCDAAPCGAVRQQPVELCADDRFRLAWAYATQSLLTGWVPLSKMAPSSTAVTRERVSEALKRPPAPISVRAAVSVGKDAWGRRAEGKRENV